MIRARVEGQVVATRKHPSLVGWKLLLCQPIDGDGKPEGVPQVAIDPYGAGMHSKVILSTDGTRARVAVGDPMSPVRMMVVAVEDVEGAGR
jgi:ethanolamine utilization protein EutN